MKENWYISTYVYGFFITFSQNELYGVLIRAKCSAYMLGFYHIRQYFTIFLPYLPGCILRPKISGIVFGEMRSYIIRNNTKI